MSVRAINRTPRARPRKRKQAFVWYNSTAQLELVHFNSAMDSRFVLALSLLCGLEVKSQTFPYVSLSMGAGLPNHSYVDLGGVGTDYKTSVWCRTDLVTCCTSGNVIHRGQWFFPDGVALQTNGDIYMFQKPERVELRRNNSAISPTGIYRCEIPTNAVHNDTDISVRATVYVGLFANGGKGSCTKIILGQQRINYAVMEAL